jgi:hypothetical protein
VDNSEHKNELEPEFHMKATGLESEERASDLTGVCTEVDWYKAPPEHNVAHNIFYLCRVVLHLTSYFCRPQRRRGSVKKCGGAVTCAYDSIADLVGKLVKDHSRHCVPGEGGYTDLIGREKSATRLKRLGWSSVPAVCKTAVRTGAAIIRIVS